MNENNQLYCTVRSADQWFGVPIQDVKEITTQTTCSRIPHAPQEVAGYVSIRGHIFLAFDLRRLLGLNVSSTAISPDDKRSSEYANASKAAAAHVVRMLQDLQKLAGLGRNDEEGEALSDLNEKVRLFVSSNQQCLDLGVRNTNVKATRLCWGDFKNEVEQVLALTDKVMNDADDSVPAGDPSKSIAGDAARRRKLAYDMARAALVLHRSLKLQIETKSSSEDFARIDRLVTELKDRLNQSLNELLPLLPKSDAAVSVAARAAMNELAVVQAQIVDYSRQETTKKGVELLLTTAGAAVEDALKSLDRLASLFDAQGERARIASLAAYNSGFWWIIVSALVGVAFCVLASLLITRSVTLPVAQMRDLAKAMAAGDLSHRIGLKQGDEVGELALATDSLADSLSRIVSEICGASEQLAHSSENLGRIRLQTNES